MPGTLFLLRLSMFVCRYACHGVHVEPEDSLWGSDLSFHRVGHGGGAHAAGPVNNTSFRSQASPEV